MARAGAPIALQILVLLVAGLIAAQLVTLGVALFVPPDRSADYQLDVVARSLEGELKPSLGQRPLVRLIQAKSPLETGVGWISLTRAQYDLARLLGVPETNVVVQFYQPPPFAGASAERLQGGPPDGSERPPGGPEGGPPGPPDRPPGGFARPPRFGPPPDFADHPGYGPPPPPPPDQPGPPPGDDGPPPPGFGHFGPPHPPSVRGDFIAAVRTGPNRWVVVRPSPESFPNAWQRRLLLWFAVSFLIVAPIGYLFARRLVAPLAAFVGAAEQLGRDPRAPLMTLDGPAEIGRAARAFNDMQVRLKRYVEDRTAMVGAISHDLRTPLSRLRFKLERVEPTIRSSMLNDIGQMETMITSVLDFIREANEPSERRRVDLRSIAECVVDNAVMLGGSARLAPGAPVAVEVDMLAIERVLTNLVDNAIKYGGEARLSLELRETEAVVEVADDGPGLAPSELERVFQPFYRSEPARTLDVGGVGLGLSLSRSIARAHGGDVQLRSSTNGLIAELKLPLPRGGAATSPKLG